MRGRVTAVTEEPSGTTLATATSGGETEITVDDVSKLVWPAGGLQIGDEVTNERRIYSVDVAPDEDVDVIDDDEDDDADQGTLTLTAALTNAYDADTRVIQWPEVTVVEATVQIPGQAEESVLRVPKQLRDLLPTDIRTDVSGTSGDAETVELEHSDGEWVIADVVHERATGAERGFDESLAGVSGISTTTTLCSVKVVIPSTAHRVLLTGSAVFDMSNNTSGWVLGYTDNVDLTGQHEIADLSNTTAPSTIGPLTGGHVSGVYGVGTHGYLIDPFNYIAETQVPTPGEHTFSLIAYRAFGTATLDVTQARLWVVVI